MKRRIFTATGHKHRFWHKMEKAAYEPYKLWGYLLVGDGVTYYECTKCKTRKAIQDHDGWQPIDYDWLQFKSEIQIN